MMADSVFGTDLGGVGRQTGSQLPNIGATDDESVAEDRPGPTADGEPVSPAVASRRYGAAAGQGYRNTSVDAGSP
jgi:hypothetical protein